MENNNKKEETSFFTGATYLVIFLIAVVFGISRFGSGFENSQRVSTAQYISCTTGIDLYEMKDNKEVLLLDAKTCDKKNYIIHDGDMYSVSSKSGIVYFYNKAIRSNTSYTKSTLMKNTGNKYVMISDKSVKYESVNSPKDTADEKLLSK